MVFNYGKRKFRSDDSERAFSHKRVKVEQLLQNLLLDNSSSKTSDSTSQFNVNPLLDFSNERKRSRPTGIDSIISEKILLGYKDRVLAGMTLIRYMLPIAIIILHFHSWIKRLFNKFVSKFNRTHGGKRQVCTFRSFYKIMAMVEDPKINFTCANLFEVVLKENEIEANVLLMKKNHILNSKKLEEIREGESLARECNYKYWDRMSEFPGDIEMEDYLD